MTESQEKHTIKKLIEFMDEYGVGANFSSMDDDELEEWIVKYIKEKELEND